MCILQVGLWPVFDCSGFMDPNQDLKTLSISMDYLDVAVEVLMKMHERLRITNAD